VDLDGAERNCSAEKNPFSFQWGLHDEDLGLSTENCARIPRSSRLQVSVVTGATFACFLFFLGIVAQKDEAGIVFVGFSVFLCVCDTTEIQAAPGGRGGARESEKKEAHHQTENEKRGRLCVV